jgi:hypothetical protein
MTTGDAHLPLDSEMVAGLANGGMGFFSAWRWARPNLFTDDVSHLPHHLVARTHDGWVWIRDPEDPKEQLYHCIFGLRMTMAYLAMHPIGTEKAANTDKAAQMLTQLPDRCAFVSSSEGAYTIWTHDLAPGLPDHERIERQRMVRDQTRIKYCAKRDDVERQDQPAQASPQQTAHVGQTAMWSRTEEVG